MYAYICEFVQVNICFKAKTKQTKKWTPVIINIAIFILQVLLFKKQNNVTIKPTGCYES